jgi:hypothetical protein
MEQTVGFVALAAGLIIGLASWRPRPVSPS